MVRPSRSAGRQKPHTPLKQAIAEERRWIEERLHAGDSIESLIREHLRFTDALIQTCWQRFKWDENLNSWRKTRISLVAVGGYGRGELMPHQTSTCCCYLKGTTCKNTLRTYSHLPPCCGILVLKSDIAYAASKRRLDKLKVTSQS